MDEVIQCRKKIQKKLTAKYVCIEHVCPAQRIIIKREEYLVGRMLLEKRKMAMAL